MSLNNHTRSKKEIRGLSFRDIMDSEQRSSRGGPTLLYRRNYSQFQKLSCRFNQLIEFLSQRVIVVKFISEFLVYIFTRSRIFLTILAVLEDVVSAYFEDFKKVLVNRLFWGRGKFFKFTAQLIGVFLIIFVFTSYTYSAATQDSVEYNFKNLYASQNDLLVQGASTNTFIPEDRSRMDSEEYIVKAGDTVSSIADYYGLQVESIYWANDLTEDSVISPNDVLEIPPGDGLNVEVESGDNLETLAERYNSNPQMIIDVNWLDYPFELAEGQKLFIPDGEKPEPQVPEAPVYSGMVGQRASGGAPASSASVDPSVGRFLGWPVAGGAGRVTQCYSGWHNGIDIAADRGTDIVAAAPGTVSFAGCQSGGCPPLGSLYGGWGLAWSVIIDHGNGFSTIYAHLSDIHVSSGQSVSTGTSVGKVGATGTAYGIHVHFMLIRGGGWNWINPAPYMSTGLCGY